LKAVNRKVSYSMEDSRYPSLHKYCHTVIANSQVCCLFRARTERRLWKCTGRTELTLKGPIVDIETVANYSATATTCKQPYVRGR